MNKRVIQISFDILVDEDVTYEKFMKSVEELMEGDDYSVLGHSFEGDMTDAYSDWGIVNNEFTIETYPDMMLDYENDIENPSYDDTIRVFSVPRDWAMEWISQKDGRSFDEFMSEYTWDNTYAMYCDSIREGMLIGEHIEPR